MDASKIKCRRTYNVPCPGTMSGDYQVKVVARPDGDGWVRVRDLDNGRCYTTHASHLREVTP